MATRTVAANNFLLPNATFIAEFIAFLLILAILGRYVVPRLQAILGERQKMIEQQAEDADRAKAERAAAEEEHKRALTDARVEAAQIRENARAEAQRTVEELRAQAVEEQQRIVARGEEQLASQRASIVRELRAEIGTIAVELAEKIVNERLADDARVSATVDSFLAGLEARDNAERQTAGAGSDA